MGNVEKEHIWIIATEGFISARATLEAGRRKGDLTRWERRPNTDMIFFCVITLATFICSYTIDTKFLHQAFRMKLLYIQDSFYSLGGRVESIIHALYLASKQEKTPLTKVFLYLITIFTYGIDHRLSRWPSKSTHGWINISCLILFTRSYWLTWSQVDSKRVHTASNYRRHRPL